MARRARLYLVGCVVLVSLSSCARGFLTAERAPWRAEAEIACLKTGTVRPGPGIVRIDPIDGPGACGMEFPLKVSAFDDGPAATGFADQDLRPPAPIGNQPPWPITRPVASYPQTPSPQASAYPDTTARRPAYGTGPSGPVSLTAPGVAPDRDGINLPSEGMPGETPPVANEPYTPAQPVDSRYGYAPPASHAPDQLPPLGPGTGNPVTTFGPVEVKPAATLACPIVSVLDRWIEDSVQPAAMHWFGAPVVEIKQISSYSCRGMNGNPNAHISEHAFGNALDIAAFVLSDGRKITVKDGWHGLPEEQGFLRDVEASACQNFNTVLAPGANVYHRDHMHVDLMRRARRPYICEPAPVSGAAVAARAARRSPYASRAPLSTGSIDRQKQARRGEVADEDDE